MRNFLFVKCLNAGARYIDALLEEENGQKLVMSGLVMVPQDVLHYFNAFQVLRDEGKVC